MRLASVRALASRKTPNCNAFCSAAARHLQRIQCEQMQRESSRAGLRNSISDRRFEHIEVDVAKCTELDAIPRYAHLAKCPAIGLSQVCLVIEPHDVNGDPGCVGTQANLIELSASPIGVGDGQESIPDVRVGDHSTALVLAVQEPQPTVRHNSQHHTVQRLHVIALALRLSGQVVADLRVHVHVSLRSCSYVQRTWATYRQSSPAKAHT